MGQGSGRIAALNDEAPVDETSPFFVPSLIAHRVHARQAAQRRAPPPCMRRASLRARTSRGMGAKAMMEGIGTPSSIKRRPAQHGSFVSKNNSLRVLLTGVYDVGTTERR
jgi:hypothetical protein